LDQFEFPIKGLLKMSEPLGTDQAARATRTLFNAELARIRQGCERAGISLRVFGSVAFDMRCPKFGYLKESMARTAYSDIDLAAYSNQAEKIQALMKSLGYLENREVYIVSEGQRAIYERAEKGLHIDIFYDKLDFCHVIQLAGRLEMDSASIPLAEMLLAKMQIVQINEKDVIDTIILLLEYPMGDVDEGMINIGYIARLCGNDWGLWRTTTMNLEKVGLLSQGYDRLPADQKATVERQVKTAMGRIGDEPKSLAWRLRAKVGDRLKWYKDVEEIE
jgi:hypothetical protein